MDSLRHRLKKSGLNPTVENRGNLMNKKIRDLENEIKNLKKEFAQKNEVIDVLKKINRHNLQSLKDKHIFIDENCAEHSVSLLCRVLNVSKSNYYATKSRPEGKREKSDKKLIAAIIETHEKYPAMGLDSIYHYLKPNCGASRARIHRLMKKHNIHSCRVKACKRTTNSNHSLPVSPNLLNGNFKVERPNKVWVGDITYIPTG